MRTIVVGLGNPIMGDDGIGARLVDRLKGDFPAWIFEKVIAVGWELLDLCADFDRLVILDAMKIGEPTGTVRRFPDFKAGATLHLAASHGLDLFTSVELGKILYPHFPAEVVVYGIEVENPFDFHEGFTPVVKEKLEDIVEAIKKELSALSNQPVTT